MRSKTLKKKAISTEMRHLSGYQCSERQGITFTSVIMMNKPMREKMAKSILFPERATFRRAKPQKSIGIITGVKSGYK
jgi:hypothetical protein